MEREACGIFYSAVAAAAVVVYLTPSLMVVRVTMDFFQHRYYKLNKILMTLIGHWPYQSIGARRGVRLAFLFISGMLLTPLILGLVKHREDETILLDSSLPLLFFAIATTEFIGFMSNSNKTLKLLNRIRTDWHEWAQDPEIDILHQYAEQERKMIIAYVVMNITNHSVFIAQPMIPKIIDNFLKNGTKPGALPCPVDFYHIDEQKYYFYIIAFSYVCASSITIVVTTNGVMLICYVQHVCSIFAALGHKIERLGNNRSLVKTGDTRSALDKQDITLCIKRHSGAIEYVNLIGACYSWTFFFVIGFGMIEFNIIGLQVLMRTNDPETSIRFMIFVFSITLYFYIDCYISETVMDHSIGIYFCIHNSQWYKLSLECQKLLQFMTMRSSIPCQLTAAKMLVMSMKGFWQVAKAGISYLTFVRSMQEL